MLTFDDSIGVRVVQRNVNMPNTKAVRQPVQSRDVRSPIVCDKFLNSAPTTEYVFENEIAKSIACFGTKRMPFQPSRQGASCLSDVSEARSKRHNHCVNIHFAE